MTVCVRAYVHACKDDYNGWPSAKNHTKLENG